MIVHSLYYLWGHSNALQVINLLTNRYYFQFFFTKLKSKINNCYIGIYKIINNNIFILLITNNSILITITIQYT